MNEIERIEKILSNENFFNEYIKEIENKDIKIPDNLESDIYNKLSKEKNIKVNIHKFNFIDIIKIAACTILSVILWQFTLFSSSVYASKISERKEKRNEVYIKMENVIENMSNFLLEPNI